MGLKERKYICNTGKLPGFADGTIPAIPNSTVNLTGGSAGVVVTNSGVTANQSPNVTYTPSNRVVTPMNLSQPRVQNPTPQTNNGITTNAGTGGNYGIKDNAGSSSAAAGAGPFFAIGSWLGEGVLSGLAAVKKSSDQYLMDAGTSQANINGIGYTKLNNVDVAGIMGDYDKEAGTAWLTNPGKAITMLFGRSAAKRAAENAAIHADIMQGAARDNAYTQYLRLDNAKRYGNTNDQLMYAAKDGKLPKYKEGLVSGETNAKVSNGEFIAREIIPGQFVGYRVSGPKNNKDSRDAHLEPEDYVISNNNGSSDIAARGDIIGAINNMIATGNPKYKRGKLPRFSTGWASNFIPSAIGSLFGLELMIHAYNNKPYKPNTYVANPYETEALSTLAGLRVNPYPIMNQLRSAEARTNRATDIAGGLSGALRAYSRLAGLNTTLNNIANLLMNAQLLNNQYKTNYAQQALNAGNATRTARMSANQYDLDYFSKAHAARLGGIQMGARNILEQAQQYYANEFKRNQFNDTMALYRADQELKKKTDAWMMKNLGGYDINNNKTLTDSLILDMYKRGLLRRV